MIPAPHFRQSVNGFGAEQVRSGGPSALLIAFKSAERALKARSHTSLGRRPGFVCSRRNQGLKARSIEFREGFDTADLPHTKGVRRQQESMAFNRPRRHYRLLARDHVIELGSETRIMGVLNITPDSFYEGSRFPEPSAAAARAAAMAAEGADILARRTAARRSRSTLRRRKWRRRRSNGERP
ncbi:MAG: dihydropteroate synthase [Acidobacteria bacterium]|nr:dihydropteroate synthase [Acidobacteriota bacterium]